MKRLLGKITLSSVLVYCFFISYYLFGFLIYKDYGISWDEPTQRQLGYINFNYVIGRDQQALFQFNDKYYGPIFEIFLVVVERLLKLENPFLIYTTRHLITFSLFYFSVIAFYSLTKELFKSKYYGLICSTILIVSPRIFADSFYNSKDIPLLALFIIASWSLMRLLKNISIKWAIIHAIVTGILIDVRLIGGLVPLLTVILLFLMKSKISNIRTVILTYLILSTASIIVFWPLLWSNPLNIFSALSLMTHYGFNPDVLYLGKYISPHSLPWHYIPVWIAVTTPITYSLLFIVGIVATINSLTKGLRNKVEIINHYFFVYVLAIIFVPIVLMVALNSTLYDGWRHLYFIYPFLIIVIAKSLTVLPRYTVAIVFIEIAMVIFWMYKNHPYQNVYFNTFLNNDMKRVKENFELDYWGLSYRKALEYIVKHDDSKVIPILVSNNPGNSNSQMLETKDRERLHYLVDGDFNNAKYFVTNYRWHNGEYPFKSEVFTIKIGSAKIMSVFKLK